MAVSIAETRQGADAQKVSRWMLEILKMQDLIHVVVGDYENRDKEMQANADEFRRCLMRGDGRENLVMFLAESEIRCVRKMGCYLNELERRGYSAPMRFKVWTGEEPWLDLQVLEVTAGRKRLQLRTEDDILPISAMVRERFEEQRKVPE